MTYRVPAGASDGQSVLPLLLAPWFCMVVGCAAESGSAGAAPHSSGNSAEHLSVPIPLPEFSLMERSSKTVTLGDLQGKVWVADFIFTRCPGPCPRMSRRFADLQQAFARMDDFRLVSISVDPEHDTPEVLADYAKSYNADSKRWLFLTGSKQAILDLAVRGFKIAADEENPDLHGLHFALVDRNGRVRGYYRSGDNEAIARLRGAVRKLAQEPAE